MPLHILEIGNDDGCPDENRFALFDRDLDDLEALAVEYAKAEKYLEDRNAAGFAAWLKENGKLTECDYAFVRCYGPRKFRAEACGGYPAP
jgi:hypothetical protein